MLWAGRQLSESLSGLSSVLDDAACLLWEYGFVSLEEEESVLDSFHWHTCTV